jgi:hypothetical protein
VWCLEAAADVALGFGTTLFPTETEIFDLLCFSSTVPRFLC